MKKMFKCSVCRKEKHESPFLYPGKKPGEGRKYVCTSCHTLRTDNIKTAAKKKKHLPGGRFGV